jgi:hypothetical protein
MPDILHLRVGENRPKHFFLTQLSVNNVGQSCLILN